MRNFAASRAFYTETLGFPVDARFARVDLLFHQPAREIFDAHMPAPNQLTVLRADVVASRETLGIGVVNDV